MLIKLSILSSLFNYWNFFCPMALCFRESSFFWFITPNNFNSSWSNILYIHFNLRYACITTTFPHAFLLNKNPGNSLNTWYMLADIVIHDWSSAFISFLLNTYLLFYSCLFFKLTYQSEYTIITELLSFLLFPQNINWYGDLLRSQFMDVSFHLAFTYVMRNSLSHSFHRERLSHHEGTDIFLFAFQKIHRPYVF